MSIIATHLLLSPYNILAKYGPPIVGQLPAKYRLMIGQQSINSRSTVGQQEAKR